MVINRSIKPEEASEINNGGASTDQERIQAIANHVMQYHSEDSAKFYYDSAREKTLSRQLFSVDFFRPGKNTNRYLYYQGTKPSSSVPYKLPLGYNYCLVGYHFTMNKKKSGDICELRDKGNNYETILTINLHESKKEQYLDTLNIDISPSSSLCAYATNVESRNPILRIFFRIVRPQENR